MMRRHLGFGLCVAAVVTLLTIDVLQVQQAADPGERREASRSGLLISVVNAMFAGSNPALPSAREKTSQSVDQDAGASVASSRQFVLGGSEVAPAGQPQIKGWQRERKTFGAGRPLLDAIGSEALSVDSRSIAPGEETMPEGAALVTPVLPVRSGLSNQSVPNSAAAPNVKVAAGRAGDGSGVEAPPAAGTPVRSVFPATAPPNKPLPEPNGSEPAQAVDVARLPDRTNETADGEGGRDDPIGKQADDAGEAKGGDAAPARSFRQKAIRRSRAKRSRLRRARQQRRASRSRVRARRTARQRAIRRRANQRRARRVRARSIRPRFRQYQLRRNRIIAQRIRRARQARRY